MEYYFGAGSSNCGQLGPNLAIPDPKFVHPILVTLHIAALAPILISLGSFYWEMDRVHDRSVGC